MVGIEIDPHLTRGGRHHEDRSFRNRVAAGDQAVLLQLPSRLLPLVHAPAADEQNDLGLERLLSGLFSEGFRDLLGHLPIVAVDQRASRPGRRTALVPHESPGPFGQHAIQLRVLVEVFDGERLRRFESCPDVLVRPIIVVEGEWGLRSRGIAQSCRQRQHPEGWRTLRVCLHPGETTPWLPGMAGLRRALPCFDGSQQPFEGTGKMRLVQHHESVAAHQTRRVGPHPPGDAIPLEEQAGADHVHGADDDCRGCRIFQPFTIVDVFAAQGGNRQRPVSERQPPPYRFKLRTPWSFESIADVFGKIGGLIDHGASIDDMDQTAGQGCSRGPSQQPERHDRGLAEAGRDVHGGRQIAGGQPLEQSSLPGKGLVSGERLEGSVEVERSRHDPGTPAIRLDS